MTNEELDEILDQIRNDAPKSQEKENIADKPRFRFADKWDLADFLITILGAILIVFVVALVWVLMTAIQLQADVFQQQIDYLQGQVNALQLEVAKV